MHHFFHLVHYPLPSVQETTGLCVPVSVPAVAQIQRTQIDIRFVDAGCSQATGGLSSARPGAHRVMYRVVVGGGGSRWEGASKE